MPSIPKQIERPEMAYAFIRYRLPMSDMAKPAMDGFPRLMRFLAGGGIRPTGAPFYNYRRIDMAATLDVEAGVPVERAGTPGEGVEFGTLPSGRFIAMEHRGHYDELYDATAMLIGWAKERGIVWDSRQEPDGEHWACRLEIYETDPDDVPDPKDWVTLLEFKLG